MSIPWEEWYASQRKLDEEGDDGIEVVPCKCPPRNSEAMSEAEVE